MRVVLDTNILISACWKAGGLEDQVLSLGLAGHFTIVVSPTLWAEYLDVLARPKFLKVKPRIDAMLARFQALRVEPAVKLDLATDPDDNCVLECALAAGAAYIVTGNLKHYPLDWQVARIVNARHFLEDNHYSIRVASAVP